MNDRIQKAIRREKVDATPIWFMRQAGRSLPRYRAARAEAGMFEVLQDPAAAAEITAMPLDYFPVDACVLYNDLSTPYFGAGFDVEMRPGVGPVVDWRIASPADVDRLTPYDPAWRCPTSWIRSACWSSGSRCRCSASSARRSRSRPT
jgi:uroporphyrinogen decarboxylase